MLDTQGLQKIMMEDKGGDEDLDGHDSDSDLGHKDNDNDLDDLDSDKDLEDKDNDNDLEEQSCLIDVFSFCSVISFTM